MTAEADRSRRGAVVLCSERVPTLLPAGGLCSNSSTVCRNVTEGPGSNVFSVRNGKLATPDRDLFERMTRRTVIDLSTDLGLPCEVRPVAVEELRNSDEIFITSTAGGIMPVTDLDGRIYGNGKPGPITIKDGRAAFARRPSRQAASP